MSSNFNGKDTVRPIFEVAKNYQPTTEVFPCSMSFFDKAMDGGFRGGELVVISGDTGQGKTTFSQVLTKNFHNKSIPSLWFSYECNPWYLKEKFVQMGCDKDLLAYSPIELAENTIDFLLTEIKEAKEKFACKVVFIDHLHYLIPLSANNNSSLLIGHIIRSLKRMCVEEDIIIFLIAHTKKIHSDEKLELSSIRDSSLIAQEADYVYLVERIKKSQKKINSGDTEWTNQTRVSLAKNRRTGKMMFVEFNYKDNNLIEIDGTRESEEPYNGDKFIESTTPDFIV